MSLTLAIEPPDQPDVHAMLAAADALYASLYPPEENFLLDVAALAGPGVAFYVARRAGAAIGCGAVVAQTRDWAEVKRMYVDPARRGEGIGRAILAALEAHARRDGIRMLRLETGIRQPAALSLYRAAGFTPRGPFGAYAGNTTSLFFEKALG